MRTNEDQTTKSTTTAAGTANQDSIKDAAAGSENSKGEKRQVTIPSAPSAQDRASKADANRRGDSDSNEL